MVNGNVILQTDYDSHNNGQLLIRSNMLIQSKYETGLKETKILALAMYRAQKEGSLSVGFSTDEICEAIGMKKNSRIYDSLRDASMSIAMQYIMIERTDGRKGFSVMPVVSKCEYCGGKFTMVFNNAIVPYLFNLRTSYTATEIGILMRFGISRPGKAESRNYAFRIYDILKTKKYLITQRSPYVDVEYTTADLKLTLGIINAADTKIKKAIDSGMPFENIEDKYAGNGAKYRDWYDLRKKVIEPSIDEINEISDICVSYRPARGKHGKVSSVIFRVTKNTAYNALNMPVKIVDKTAEQARKLIKEPLSSCDIASIVDAAGGDMGKIRYAYALAMKQQAPIRDLAAWLRQAVKEGWTENDDPIPLKSVDTKRGTAIKITQRNGKNAFCDFKQNTYNFEELESELENAEVHRYDQLSKS